MLNFEGRVAIVTGAGRGIGRATALALAKRGARVLVNDYGGGADTLTAGGLDVAQTVVDEIRAAGGFAVADQSSVGTGDSARSIVRAAVSAFGRIDILVNNAGGSQGAFEVDGDSDERVEAVISTNLIGPLMLVRKIWPILREQGYGRVVNVSSSAVLGIDGMLAYAAAKGGVIGLSNACAGEGRSHGILVNTVFPAAYTRGIGLRAPGSLDWLRPFTPELVAEGITFLCSSECTVAGELFRIGGGRFGRYGIFGNKGIHDAELTAEIVGRRFEESRDLNDVELMLSASQDMTRLGIDAAAS